MKFASPTPLQSVNEKKRVKMLGMATTKRLIKRRGTKKSHPLTRRSRIGAAKLFLCMRRMSRGAVATYTSLWKVNLDTLTRLRGCRHVTSGQFLSERFLNSCAVIRRRHLAG